MNLEYEIKQLNYTIYMIFGMMFVLTGGLMNHQVVISNDGRMPVKADYFLDTDHHFGYSEPSEINYYLLSDKYSFEIKKGTIYLSIGDFFVFFGLYILLRNYYLSIKFKKAERRKKKQMTNEEQSSLEILDIDPSTIEESDSVREDLIDFEKYRLEKCKIATVEVVRVKSGYAKAKDGKVHRLRVTGEIVESVEVEKANNVKEKIDFRPSCLIGMEEDLDGKMLGYPKRDKSDYQKFIKALSITNVKDAVGKELPMSINETASGSKFLNFFFN